jgi:hypothetical protein
MSQSSNRELVLEFDEKIALRPEALRKVDPDDRNVSSPEKKNGLSKVMSSDTQLPESEILTAHWMYSLCPVSWTTSINRCVQPSLYANSETAFE